MNSHCGRGRFGFVLALAFIVLAAGGPVLSRDGAGAHYSSALKLFESGDLEGAIESMEEAYSLDEDNPQIQRWLGVLTNNMGVKLAREGRDEDALEYYERSIEVFPVDKTKSSYANSLYAAERPYDAIRVLDRLVYSDNPETVVTARWTLGQVHFNLRNFEQAAVELEEVLYSDGENADAHLLLARCYTQTGDKERAAEHFQRARELTDNEDVKEVAQVYGERVQREAAVEDEFQQDGSRHFKLVFQSGREDELTDLILTHLEDAYDEVGSELRYYPDRETVCVIYTPDQFSTVTQLPSWVAGAYHEWMIRIPVPTGGRGSDSLETVVFHEYTHLLVHALAKGNCPLWLNEGLAVRFQPTQKGFENVRLLKAALNSKLLPPIKNLDSFFRSAGDYKQAILAYTASLFLVRFIEKEWGLYRVPRMLEEYKDGYETTTVLQDVLGYDLDRFEHRWHEYIEDL